MGRLLGRIATALAALMVLSFGLSNLLLSGEDPTGWWNFVPAYVFYATTFVLLPVVGVVALVVLAASGVRRLSCR
jgi:hypothetical protein